MAPPAFKSASTALITGAASGIGLAIAQRCAKHGMNLALVDIHAETLATVVASLEGAAEIETYAVDVTKIEQWKELKVNVGKKFGAVHLLVLNAGVNGKSSWEDSDYFRRVRNPLMLIKFGFFKRSV
jgi:short-subunit dehydrogenase